MLKKLIEITNSEEFLEDGHIAIKEVVARQREFDLKVIFDIQFTFENITKFHCEIYCEALAVAHRVHEYKRPYNRINLYQDHPVLWNFESSKYLTLKGKNINIAELMGDLFLVHDKACGNWIDFHELFNNIPEWLYRSEGATIEIPERLVDIYKSAFDKHKVAYSIGEVRKAHNKYMVLLFGNPDISPDRYNFGQPYIVAEKFTETLKTADISLLQ